MGQQIPYVQDILFINYGSQGRFSPIPNFQCGKTDRPQFTEDIEKQLDLK